MVGHTCKACTWEVKARDQEVKGSLSYIISLGWLGLHKSLSQKLKSKSGAVEHSFNPSTHKAEAGGVLWVPGQPGIHS